MHDLSFLSIARPRKLVVLLLAMAMALIATALVAGPVGAQSNDEAGSGAGEGEEESITTGDHVGPGPPPFCLEVKASSYYADVVGTFSATNAEGRTAVYEGPARVKYTTNETYYIGPEGTYTEADPATGCDTTTLGDEISTTVEVVQSPVLPSTGGSITCPADTTGEYFRLASDVTVRWEAACQVEGNVPPFDQPANTDDVIRHLFTGELEAATGTLVGAWEYPDPTK